MSELRDLYQEVLLDHGRHPRNFRALEETGHRADGHNPLCGDRLTVFLIIDEGRIVDVSFRGSGCAISMASASMMTEALKGKTLDEAERLFDDFHELLTGNSAADAPEERLGKLVVFRGVRDFPVRVKCATLAWHTLRSAMADRPTTVTTE